jgi:site-specific DNA recombinase
MTRAIGYARVSTLTQRDNETIEEQIKALREYAGANGYELVDVYRDDGISGADQERVIRLGRYIQDHQDDFDVFLFTYFDRLSRDLYFQLFIEKELKKAGKSYLAIYQESLSEGDSPMINAMRQMAGVFAELEKNMIVRRLANGRKHKTLARGIKASGNVPFGYAYAGKGTRDKRVVVDLDQAEIVREMFGMASNGVSVRQIARAMTDRGVVNSRGRPFNGAAVHWILTSEFYAGKVKYDGRVVEGDHEAIISPVLFGKVQKALHRRANS